MKKKKYRIPQKIFIQSKEEYKSLGEQHVSLKKLNWSNKEVETMEFRVLLIYSQANSKGNKAVYSKNYEEALQVTNFLLFQNILETGYNFGKKMEKLSFIFKAKAASLFQPMLVSYVEFLSKIRKLNSQKSEEENQEKILQKEKYEKLMNEISFVFEKISVDFVKEIVFRLRDKAYQMKEIEERKLIDQEVRLKSIKQYLLNDFWVKNIKKLIINESLIQKWLSKTIELKEQKTVNNNEDFRIYLVEIETPISNWMELFKPIILVSGHFLPENVIVASPSHSPLKTLFVKKNEFMKNKSMIALSSYDCFLRKKEKDKLIWDISLDDPRPLKSTELEVIGHLILEFLDEGNENGFTFQKGKSHRLELPMNLLKDILVRLKSEYFWFPLKRISKDEFNEKENLYLKVKKMKADNKENFGIYYDEIYKKKLHFEFIEDLLCGKPHSFIKEWLRENFNKNFFDKNMENSFFLRSLIHEKNNELSIKSYWSSVEQFVMNYSSFDQKKVFLKGLPNFIRRKLWGLEEKKKLIEIADYLLDKRSNEVRNSKTVFQEIQKEQLKATEVYEKLLKEANKIDNTVFLININKDITFLGGLESQSHYDIISNVMKALNLWAKINGKSLVYSQNLLIILINLLHVFENDPLFFYYSSHPGIIDWIELLSSSKTSDISLKIPLKTTNFPLVREELSCDIFWSLAFLINGLLCDYYLINEDIKTNKSTQKTPSDLKGIKGALIILRSYLQEFNADSLAIFEENEGNPYGLEMVFGDLFLNLMSSFGGRNDLLFRIWDICFFFGKAFSNEIKYSAFVISVIITFLKKVKPFLSKVKNYFEFKTFSKVFLILLEDNDDFINKAIKETIKINEYISKKWHIWRSFENKFVDNTQYFKKFLSITQSFLLRVEEKSYNIPKINNLEKEPENQSLHLFIYELNFFHKEFGFIIEISINSMKKYYKCFHAHNTKFILDLYESFPVDNVNNKYLRIRIFSTIYEHRSSTSSIALQEDSFEEFLMKNNDLDKTSAPQQIFIENLKDDFALFSLIIDLNIFQKGVLNKGIYKFYDHQKKPQLSTSLVEMGILITESLIVSESYFKKEPSFWDENTVGLMKVNNLENKEHFTKLLLNLHSKFEDEKNGILMCERANNLFFMPIDCFEDQYFDYETFSNRAKNCGFDNEAAARWVFESLRNLKFKDKKHRNYNLGILFPEFAAAVYLLSPEHGLAFLFGEECNKMFGNKISLLNFKLFLKFLYQFLSVPLNLHYIENFFDFLRGDHRNNSKIYKALFTIEASKSSNITKINITDILRELAIFWHQKFGSKDIFLGDDSAVLKEICIILKNNPEFKSFFDKLNEERFGDFIVKYETSNGFIIKKIFKFNSNYEIFEEKKQEVSLKPMENMFRKLANSICFNSFSEVISIEDCKKFLPKIPLLDYLRSYQKLYILQTNNFLCTDFTFKDKLKVEVNINSSLFVSFECLIDKNTIKSFQRLDDYYILASQWKFYWRNEYKKILKFEIFPQEDDEDLSEMKNNEITITTTPISIFVTLKEFILLIQRKLMIILREGLENKSHALLRAIQTSKSLLMLDFFSCKLRISFKNTKESLFLPIYNNIILGNILSETKSQTLVFDYKTANIDEMILANLINAKNSHFPIVYTEILTERELLFEDFAYFRHLDGSKEWKKAHILNGYLKTEKKEKKHGYEYSLQKKEIRKKDFDSFEVVFKEIPNEKCVIREEDVWFMRKINLKKFVKMEKI